MLLTVDTWKRPASAPERHRSRFYTWRKRRPFFGGLMIVLGGLELFFSGQLDLGNIHLQLGIEGMQTTILPFAMAALGVLIIAMPQHRVFYGIIALAIAVYAIIGVNLGGFIIGSVLGIIGGISAVSWLPKTDAATQGAQRREPARAR